MPVFCADAAANSGLKLIYPTFDYFRGVNITIAGDEKSYATNDPAVEKLLTSTPKGREYLDNYYFKNNLFVILSTVTTAVIVSDVADLESHSWKKETTIGETEAEIVVLSFLECIGGYIIEPLLKDQAYNELNKSINEYNLTVCAGKGVSAEVNKNIKF